MASIQVLPATPEDVSSLTHVILSAFSTPHDREMFPDTPGIHAWWDEFNRHDLLHKPGVRYVKAVDMSLPGSIMACAKWDFQPENRGNRFPPWHEDSNQSECGAFFGECDAARQAVMKDRKHYFLDILVTDPDHRRRGAATLLLRWGCDMADQAGMPIYLDATESGAPVYQKHDFVIQPVSIPLPGDIVAMVREPQPKK
ncbi:hypothetical protein FE257_004429 [Aspergillus nanangensis]|uniref:N-acetyltransferase domain-containing protein n=1 Tax=Aspergillus nanangensis TaxID=2582783 RepID=A0AAD4H0K6_ASPNN|nr:hypothetical protein FE257_004429 [Aspergillus nanangensis]